MAGRQQLAVIQAEASLDGYSPWTHVAALEARGTCVIYECLYDLMFAWWGPYSEGVGLESQSRLRRPNRGAGRPKPIAVGTSGPASGRQCSNRCVGNGAPGVAAQTADKRDCGATWGLACGCFAHWASCALGCRTRRRGGINDWCGCACGGLNCCCRAGCDPMQPPGGGSADNGLRISAARQGPHGLGPD